MMLLIHKWVNFSLILTLAQAVETDKSSSQGSYFLGNISVVGTRHLEKELVGLQDLTVKWSNILLPYYFDGL